MVVYAGQVCAGRWPVNPTRRGGAGDRGRPQHGAEYERENGAFDLHASSGVKIDVRDETTWGARRDSARSATSRRRVLGARRLIAPWVRLRPAASADELPSTSRWL